VHARKPGAVAEENNDLISVSSSFVTLNSVGFALRDQVASEICESERRSNSRILKFEGSRPPRLFTAVLRSHSNLIRVNDANLAERERERERENLSSPFALRFHLAGIFPRSSALNLSLCVSFSLSLSLFVIRLVRSIRRDWPDLTSCRCYPSAQGRGKERLAAESTGRRA